MTNKNNTKIMQNLTQSCNYTCSALICYYRNDNPDDLKKALISIFDQNLLNFEVVLVRDGPVGINLELIVEQFEKEYRFKHIKLPVNKGLALALNAGLEQCASDYVIRCDADDFNDLDRFKKLVNKLDDGFDIVGSSVIEFDPFNGSEQLKEQPVSDADIKKEMALRNSLNHQSVAFKKSKILTLGGYREIHLAEDYDLWLRAILANLNFFNLKEPLVLVSAGDALLKRRRGLKFMISEIQILFVKLRIKHYSRIKVLFFTLLRILTRYSPKLVVKYVYKTFLRKKLN